MGVALRRCLSYDDVCPAPWVCVSGSCVALNKTGSGVPLDECEQTCLSPNPLYICVNGACIVSVVPGRGVPKNVCITACH
jgi:hypothetical protein